MMHSAELEEAVVISGPRKGVIITLPFELTSDAALSSEDDANLAQCVDLARHVENCRRVKRLFDAKDVWISSHESAPAVYCD